MKKLVIGITAHVDSGKTTLAEALLYESGKIRRLGRVDNKNAFLDNNSIERSRGITIFSHQADFEFEDMKVFLLDTPGHVDFSAETERTMSVLDYAILVVSSEGVQSHTLTLWKLLRKYRIPVFIFVNKMDMVTAEPSSILQKICGQLSENCVDFSVSEEELHENCAACCEGLMNKYLENGSLSDSDIADAVAGREIFPCFFGSALKINGIREFLRGIERFSKEPERSENFGAKIYKVSYDSKGTRLTHMKITGGELPMRSEINFRNRKNQEVSGKISSIRFYSGEKFRTEKKAEAGEVCAVTGLDETYAGLGIGNEKSSDKFMLEPVMTYNVVFPEEKNAHDVLKDMRCLEDEDPQLHIIWNEQLKEIHIQLMGAVQTEVLTQLVLDKFGYAVSFDKGSVAYKETIAAPAEGVGHYEPLKHYAEVHLLLEPLPAGSGLQFDTVCSEDDLDRNWQRLILTHLEEKTHIGTLTGSPVTDMKITLSNGKAHLKHTEGGDFRQATYRAVRQGLRSAGCKLLEPYYDYELSVPAEYVGRAILDLQHMSADFSQPVSCGDMSVITGSCPVAEMNGYQNDLISYTHGQGKLSCTNSGYRECHNPEAVIEAIGYDCDSDTENTADSVFCRHGAGHSVKWNEVYEQMHLPLYHTPKNPMPVKNYRRKEVSEEELMEIFNRTYGSRNSDRKKNFNYTAAKSDYSKKVSIPNYKSPDYMLVDGYNIIFSWEELKKISETNLDAARHELAQILSNYQGFTGYEIILVFDAYRIKGGSGSKQKFYNINIVYTKESETADTYIEYLSHELSGEHRVYVATSDGTEQSVIFGNGAMRISASELKLRIDDANKKIREKIENKNY